MNFKKTADTLIKNSHTLDRKYYMSKKILNKEYENIFFNQWICVGRESELIQPGQYKVTFRMLYLVIQKFKRTNYQIELPPI